MLYGDDVSLHVLRDEHLHVEGDACYFIMTYFPFISLPYGEGSMWT